MVQTFGTGKLSDAADRPSRRASTSTCAPPPSADYLDLHRPIFQKTAAYGHFGREDPDFTWERTDRADALRAAAGLEAERSPPDPDLGAGFGRLGLEGRVARTAVGRAVDLLDDLLGLRDPGEDEVGVIGAGGVEVDVRRSASGARRPPVKLTFWTRCSRVSWTLRAMIPRLMLSRRSVIV